MTEKQTILGRIGQLTRANINALVDRAEDPQKMLDQLIRDYTNSIVEAEGASGLAEKVRREEARVAGQAEIAASSLDSQFEELEDQSVDTEVAARLAALKGGASF